MNWIRLSLGVGDDPKIHQLATALNIRVAEAVGLTVGVMVRLPEHAPDGDLSRVPPTLLERWAGWMGDTGVFYAAFSDAFLTDGVWAAWEKHNGTAIKESEESKKRSKAWRERRKAAQMAELEAEQDSERVANGVRTRSERVTNAFRTPLRTNERTNERTELLTTPPAADAVNGNWVAAATDLWVRTVGAVSHGEMGKTLKPVVQVYGPEVVLAAIENFARARDRRMRAGEERIPGLPGFARNIREFIPMNLVPPEAA